MRRHQRSQSPWGSLRAGLPIFSPYGVYPAPEMRAWCRGIAKPKLRFSRGLAPNTKLIRHSHEIGERARLHLSHQVYSMDLDRDLADAEIRRDAFIAHPRAHERHDLPLSGGQGLVEFPQLGGRRRFAAPLSVRGECAR